MVHNRDDKLSIGRVLASTASIRCRSYEALIFITYNLLRRASGEEYAVTKYKRGRRKLLR